MAAASGFATSIAGVKKMESLLCNTSSRDPPSQVRIFCKPTRNRRRFIERGVSLNTMCEAVVSEDDNIDSRTSSVSALGQLKMSAVDRYTKERSSIVVIGLSVHTAPVEMHEKLAILEAEWPRAIGELCGLNHIEEAAVLSTCNRMEIYVVALSWHRGISEVTEWMAKTSGIPASELRRHLFLLRDKDATQHLFAVSAGLDSLGLGEGRILAQVRQVVKVGQGVKGFGRKISGLFNHAIQAGKRVREETNIAAGAVSISSAAVELALNKLPESSSAVRILVTGAGKMGKLVIKHLVAKGCTKMVVVNRSEERVAAIHDELKDVEIIYKPLTEMLTCAAEADVVFTSTSSETPLFLKEHIESLPLVGPEIGGLRLFVDISVPRNVGSCVSDLETARVYNVDDLNEFVAANKEDQHRNAIEAQAIIAEVVKDFEAQMDCLETVPTVKKLRVVVDRYRDEELKKCFSKMRGDIPNEVMEAVDVLSRSIVNKILHGPMQHLRCDESDNRTLREILQNMNALNRMFNLDTEISILEQKIQAKLEQTQK